MKKEAKKEGNKEDKEGEVLLIKKPRGWTPFQIIHGIKCQFPETYGEKKIGYAGRLDPLARGLMICLVGDENKRQKHHETVSKIYEFEVLFGINTDTYDIMGLIEEEKFEERLNKTKEKDFIQCVELLSNTFIGKRKQKYPPFSAARVKGKRLFEWAREGKDVLKSIEHLIPEIDIEILSLDINGWYTLPSTKLRDIVQKRIRKVTGGKFRQKEILQRWDNIVFNKEMKNDNINKKREREEKEEEEEQNEHMEERWKKQKEENHIDYFTIEEKIEKKMEENKVKKKMEENKVKKKKEKEEEKNIVVNNKSNNSFIFHVVSMRAEVTSGTYIRTIANQMGEKLGTGAIAFDINRTRVGEYCLEDAMVLSSKIPPKTKYSITI